jgi:Bacterial type II/III secretion system short domain
MRRLIPLLLLLLTASSSLSFARAPALPRDAAQQKVNLDLTEVPLRAAMAQLFEGSGLNYAVEPAVPNVSLTMTANDTPRVEALRRMVRIASVQVPHLVLAYDGDIYILRLRRPQPPAEAEEPPPPQDEMAGDEVEYHWEKIPVNYKDVAQIVPLLDGELIPGWADAGAELPPPARLAPGLDRFLPGGLGAPAGWPGGGGLLPPDLVILGHRGDNTLIVRGTDASIAELKTLLRLMDVPEEQLLVRIATDRLHAEGEVLNRAPLQLTDRAGASRFEARLTPRLNNDGAVEVAVEATFHDGPAAYPLKTRVRLAPGVTRRIATLGKGRHRIPVWVRALSLPQIAW